MADKRYCFIGPFHGVMTGQRKCLEVAANVIPGSKKISVSGQGVVWFKSIFIFILGFLKFLKFIFSNLGARKVVYLTPSRSVAGFIRDIPFLLISKLIGAYIVEHWHGADINSLCSKRVGIGKCYAFFHSLSDVHIVLTSGMLSQLRCFSVKSSVVLPNFSEQPNRELVKARLADVCRSPKVLYFSNVMEEKGIYDFIEVAKSLPTLAFSVAGPLIGQGVFQTEVLSQIEEEKNISYLGAVYGKEKDELLYDHDILLFPSFYKTEAFPLVVCEAMAFGMTVIAYNHNYMAEVLEGSKNILCEARSINCMVDQLKTVLKYETRQYIGEDNISFARKYSLKAYVRGITEILQECEH